MTESIKGNRRLPLEQSRVHGFSVRMVYALAFLAFYVPQVYAIPSEMRSVWFSAEFAVSCIALLLYLRTLRNNKVSGRWILLCLFFVSYYIISSLLASNDVSMGEAVTRCIYGCGFVSLVEVGLIRDKSNMLKGFVLAGLLMCGWHYVTFLQYADTPGGMQRVGGLYSLSSSKQHWFLLTHDNGSLFYFLPLLAALAVCAKRFKGAWLFVYAVFMIASLYMYFRLNSVTAMFAFSIAAFATAAGLMFDKQCRVAKVYEYAVVGGICFCLFVVYANVSGQFFDIAQSMNKVGNMASRAAIWSNTVAAAQDSLITGYGIEPDSIVVLRIGINHCHNILLQVVYAGGLLALVLLLASVAAFRRKIFSSRFDAMLCAGVLFSFFIASTMDWYVQVLQTIMVFYLCGGLFSDATQSLPSETPDRSTNRKL